MSALTFSDIAVETPTFEQVAERYDGFQTRLLDAASAVDRVSVVQDWDTLRRELATWEALVHLRFNQDTANAEYQAARDYCDQLRPKLTELQLKLKRMLIEEPHRPAVAEHFGQHVLSLWDVDVLTYDPSIEAESVRESELEADYNQLLASAELSFHGETHNLSGITKYLEEPEREVRHEADGLRWDWFDRNRAQLDEIFDQLVKLRAVMAGKLGFGNYIELAYKKMLRLDYDRDDVARYRDEVRQHVVPLAQRIRERQAEHLGLAGELKSWDESLHDPAGNPKPQGTYDEQIESAQAMFDAMGGGLDEFFRLMCTSGLMDLKNRPKKAGGGFCTSFDSYGLPYIFANFNGTKGDVEVFTHEMGHAFQFYMSRNQSISDYFWPTYESCEIHSMGLEFLTYPHMQKFFGEDSQRFRQMHLAQSIVFLPYGVAVDHFQHLVYERPDASPDQRFEMWREMERMYLPWRDYGDLKHPASGGRWQQQRHLYLNPFYYIDYTLAQACALQFWLKSREDMASTMRSYVELCRQGGSAPFQQLLASAGLVSPFAEGCLVNVVEAARSELGL